MTLRQRLRRAIVRAAPTCTLWVPGPLDSDTLFFRGSSWLLDTRLAYELPDGVWLAVSNALMITRQEIEEAAR